MENVKLKLILNDLDCANCASKIEREVRNLPNVNKANLDFVTKKLTVEAPENEHERIKNDIKLIISRIEPDVKVVCDEVINKEEESKGDNDLFIIGISLLFFFGAIIFKFPIKVKLIMYLISYVLCGKEVLFNAFSNIKRGQFFDENFLMGIATIGAFAVNQYSEAVAVMLFYRIGEYFQNLAVNRSRKSITELMNIRPEYANLKLGTRIEKVSPEKVNVGDYIVVKPGERIPLDGVVVKGNSMIDTSALTGESMPRFVEENSDVLSGAINQNGFLSIKVTKIFKESTVAKILELVESASERKSTTENFITKFARVYTPAVVIAAVLLATIPTIIMGGAYFSQWIYRALIFLVVSCPCALVISIPLSYFGGIGGASKKGILIKGSNFIEALKDVDKIVFDKTGTLTKGNFKVSSINCEKGYKKGEILKFAAYAEVFSNHPIAKSILIEFGEDINKDNIKSYEEIRGMGIKVVLNDGTLIIAGNDKIMKISNVKYDDNANKGTIVYIAVNGKYAGNLVISDEVKEDSQRAISELKRAGIKDIIMLTGDNKEIAESVAKDLGITDFYAELLPNDKVLKFEEMQDKNHSGKIAFVGDGINDAPVLARADVGIAMGGLGSDAAIEAADIVIMTDEPSKIATAIKIAKKTNRIVWQNIIFALSVKIVVLTLGALGDATMWEAVFADVGVAFIAVINSMRSLKVD